jgi:hypothetical protein
MILLSFSSFASAKGLELSFFLGMKDGSESSDGVIVSFTVEEGGKATNVFEQLWSERKWSDMFEVNLGKWSGKSIILNLTTDPGKVRNTGWDWILIGDAKIMANDKLVYDIGQAVAGGIMGLSVFLDGDKNETKGLKFDANCTPDVGPVGGQAKPKSFMQHPAWNGKVGNTISRYEIDLPGGFGGIAVDANGKLATAWGHLKVIR